MKACSRPTCKRKHNTHWKYCPACREFAKLRSRARKDGSAAYDEGGEIADPYNANAAPKMSKVVACERCGAEMALGRMAGHIKAGCWVREWEEIRARA